jgi:hypothetical protein
MVAVRRRTGRRRRTDPPIKRKVLVVLVVTFVALLVMTAVPAVHHGVKSMMRSFSSQVHISPEMGALMIAGLALLFLIPGVEDKVLITLGIRKAPRHRNSHR